MKQTEFEYLDHKLDQTLELLKEMVHFTTRTNADDEYLEERINELLKEIYLNE